MNQHDDAVALHYQKYDADERDTGDDAVIILHGLFGSCANWRNIARRLADGRAVYCLDLRNHGRSAWRDSMTYAAMADDVARFIRDHDLRRPSLVGHSMGGKVAMTLAARGGVGKLVVVDIAPVAYPAADHRALIDAMLAVDTGGDRRQVDAALANTIIDSATRQFLLQNLVGDGDGGDGGNRYRWRLNLAALRDNLDTIAGYPDGDDGDDAAGLAVADGGDGDGTVANGDNGDDAVADGDATLFIAGGKSNYLAPHHAAVRARFPAARIHTLADAGHWLHAEQPDELSALLDAFLAA